MYGRINVRYRQYFQNIGPALLRCDTNDKSDLTVAILLVQVGYDCSTEEFHQL
jgi:hypothetical protein